MVREKSDIKGTRRFYTRDFKRDVLAECGQPGQSISGVALKRNMNANIVHKWMRLSQASGLTDSAPTFISIPIVRKDSLVRNAQTIHIEIVLGDTKIQVQWPTDDSTVCGAWMIELLR